MTEQKLEQRLLVLTPTGRDARLAESVLERAGVACFSCTTLEQVCRELGRGAAAILMAEEAVIQGRPGCLEAWLARQFPWSDLPVLVLARSGADSALVAQAISVLGNVTVLERPVRVATLVSAVRTALRGRQRQYQIREHLRELDKSAAALRDADRRKDEFLATLAHELRNPLSPIRLSLEILKRDKSDSTLQEALGIIERQTGQLVHLVDDLLDVSRITRGKINLAKERLELAEVVKLAVEGAKPLITERDHTLTLLLPEREVALEGDKTRLAQVFLNLLTNAAKYSSPGGHIILEAELEGHYILIRVKDTGFGLAAETLPGVFELFARVESGEAAKQEGLGIGLNIVKQLVELHGGTIEASSPGLGQGSTFTVRLPVLAEVAPLTVSAPATRAVKSGNSLRVLVVDDYEANLRTLSRMLKLMGHEVCTASDGHKALEVLGSFDINMPGISGYETARLIKSDPRNDGINLVALTGYGAEEDVRKAQEAGFDHHLVKPVNLARLEELLRTTPELTAL
jgi:two-component system, sensor histidine kinase